MSQPYSENDFYYVSSLDLASSQPQLNCSNPDISEPEKLLCKNKHLVNKLNDIRINQTGSTQSLEDSQTIYSATLLNTFNLVGGIGLVTWLLVKFI
jgi:hypothetical protein